MFVVGIDEVGRGALAGPVVVAAVIMPKGIKIKNLKDSKQLTAGKRELWRRWADEHPKIIYAVAKVCPRVVDKINISQAANLAATRAFLVLVKKNAKYKIASVLLDGGLYLKLKTQSARWRVKMKTIVRGDEKYNAIKLASIVAKTERDRLMERWHKIYPQYGFKSHKGYGTKSHLAAIRQHGYSSAHRLTFILKSIKF